MGGVAVDSGVEEVQTSEEDFGDGVVEIGEADEGDSVADVVGLATGVEVETRSEVEGVGIEVVAWTEGEDLVGGDEALVTGRHHLEISGTDPLPGSSMTDHHPGNLTDHLHRGTFPTGHLEIVLMTGMSRLVGKPTMWFPNRSDTNQPVQLQKQARSLKFWR